jgi:cytochrome c
MTRRTSLPAFGLLAAAGLMPLAPAAALAAGDTAHGQQIYDKQCLVCHSLEPEFHKEGPSLYKIWGKRAGTVAFFGKYKGLKGSDFVWNEKTLDEWLADPRALVAGKDSGMTFRLENPADRADVIAYLKSLR